MYKFGRKRKKSFNPVFRSRIVWMNVIIFTARCYAERGIAPANCLSVRPFVRDVEVPWSHRLKIFENSVTIVEESRRYLLHKPSCSRFCVRFRCHGNRVGRGLALEFFWHHSLALPRKPPDRRKNLGDVSYTRWLIVDFLKIFVATATGVGSDVICMTSFTGLTTKTPWYGQGSRRYVLYKPSCGLFSLPWQHGLSGGKFKWRH